MDWWQVLLAILGSNLLVEILKTYAAKKKAERDRKEELEDRRMAKDDKTKTLEERFKDFCEIQKRENSEIRQRLSGVENAVGSQSEIISSGEYITIRREALGYVKAGEVDPEDRILLKERYGRYRAISKRKDLDEIMEEVDTLRSKKK